MRAFPFFHTRTQPTLFRLTITSLLLICLYGPNSFSEQSQLIKPPIADRRDHSFTYHGITVNDPYHWLKDQSYPKIDDEDVLDYLRAENAYFDEVMKPLKGHIDELFEELKAREVKDESSVPVQDGEYMYMWRYPVGKQYPEHVRWPVAERSYEENLQPPNEDAIQLLIDENALSEGKDYFDLRGITIDPTADILTYATDTSGAERYTLRMQRISTQEYLSESIENVNGDIVWSADGKVLFYVVVDEHWRPNRVFRHRLGTPISEDELIYEEFDEGFFVGIDRSTSNQYLIVSSESNVTSEARVLDLDKPTNELTLISERRHKHEYDVDHQPGRFVIVTNDTHKNFRVVIAPEDSPTPDSWEELISPSDERYVMHVRAFTSQIVVFARSGGLKEILVLNSEDDIYSVPFKSAAYNISIGDNPAPDPSHLRLHYSSLIEPAVTYDFEFSSRTLIPRKTQEIPSGHNPEEFSIERFSVEARDGAQVPVTVAYHKDTPLDGSAPLYLYGYGAYGAMIDPSFRNSALSLLNRGFVYAIAHIRGGAELGYHWYEDGKLDRRTNTFNDFIDVARGLIDRKYTKKGRIAIAGGSAGGSLMGAVVNDAPDLWGAVAAHVPFVDILNTMLDTSLPLTPIEWDEWGDPIQDPEAFRYIQSYSPYDQVEAMNFPPMLVTGGLNDPRVTYWEPAKWVAKIRHLKTDNNLLLLKTEMGAGHGGRSGRYDSLKQYAEEYAFILHSLGRI